MTTRVLIADDEAPARARVRAMLAPHATCDVVGEARDGAAAVDAIIEESPDVVFLDVRMPGLDGFEVLAALDELGRRAPVIVFVTAFDAFAVRAFEVGALDYLLKPFDQARFDRALRSAGQRARARRGSSLPAAPHELRALLEQYARETFPQRHLVRVGRKLQFVRTADIDWVEADGNYVRLHAGGRSHLLRETMKAMGARLDPRVFVRVHRSAIVNLDHVAHAEPHEHGEYVLVMRDGARLTSSAAHGARLRELLRRG
ncbi:MAG: LytR/AlgR family response regulator transcription factor [Gemmatimonadaceae bacterium]